jgi:hypothetical protein
MLTYADVCGRMLTYSSEADAHLAKVRAEASTAGDENTKDKATGKVRSLPALLIQK